MDFEVRPVIVSPVASVITGGGISSVELALHVDGHPGMLNVIVSLPVLLQPSELA